MCKKKIDWNVTMDMSERMVSGGVWLWTLVQMNSVNVGSSSPMYSTIFLFIQGFILLSTRSCSRKGEYVVLIYLLDSYDNADTLDN